MSVIHGHFVLNLNWKTSFHLLLCLQCHLKLKKDKKGCLYIPQKFPCLILESLFRNVYSLFKRKGKSTDTKSCPDRYLFHIFEVCFFLIASLKWCHLSEEIINAPFLSSSNRKSHFLLRVSLCNRIWKNLKPHYAKIICHFIPFKIFLLLKRDWGWSALQASIQRVGKICKYPVGRGINKIWCNTLFLLWDQARHHNTATIFIMFGHPTEKQSMRVHQILVLPLLIHQTPEFLLTISSGLLLEFSLHWRVAMAVTQCLVSWGKLVVALCSSWYMGLSKNPVVSCSCCSSAQECRWCSYQSLPLLSLLPGGRCWSIAQGDCSIGTMFNFIAYPSEQSSRISSEVTAQHSYFKQNIK